MYILSMYYIICIYLFYFNLGEKQSKKVSWFSPPTLTSSENDILINILWITYFSDKTICLIKGNWKMSPKKIRICMMFYF